MRTSKNLKHIVQFVSTFSKYVEFYVILHNTLKEMTARVKDVFTKHYLQSFTYKAYKAQLTYYHTDSPKRFQI